MNGLESLTVIAGIFGGVIIGLLLKIALLLDDIKKGKEVITK